jgi:cell division protein FtsB
MEGSVLNLVRRLESRNFGRPRFAGPRPNHWPMRLGLVAVGIWLAYLFIFSNQGLLKILALRAELTREESRTTSQAKRVKLAEEELYRVRTDPFYTEKFVRENTGMVKPNEIVYRVVPESVAQQAIQARALAPPPKPKP